MIRCTCGNLFQPPGDLPDERGCFQCPKCSSRAEMETKIGVRLKRVSELEFLQLSSNPEFNERKCPACSGTCYGSTCMGYLGLDMNRVYCADCDWSGRAYEMEPTGPAHYQASVWATPFDKEDQ